MKWIPSEVRILFKIQRFIILRSGPQSFLRPVFFVSNTKLSSSEKTTRFSLQSFLRCAKKRISIAIGARISFPILSKKLNLNSLKNIQTSSHRNGVVKLFILTYNQHEWKLFQLCITDFFTRFLVSVVDQAANIVIFQQL